MNPVNLDLAQVVEEEVDPLVDHDPLANAPDPQNPPPNHPNPPHHLIVNPLYLLLKIPQSENLEVLLLNQQVDLLFPLMNEVKRETVIMIQKRKIEKENVKEIDVIVTETVKEKEMMIEIVIEMMIEVEIVIVQKVLLHLKNNKDPIVVQEVHAIRKIN
jgi:hypothetical protein